MARLIGFCAAVLLALAAQVAAQQQHPPLIRLPAETAQPDAAIGPITDRIAEPPRIRLPMPRDQAASPLPAPVRRDQPAPATASEWLMPLRPADPRLPRDGGGIGVSQPMPGMLRMTGESVRASLYLDLPQTMAAPGDLVLVTRSGVNVLTDTARIAISVNGAAPVDLPLRNIGGFGSLLVPGAHLVAGRNRVDLALHQPHRIYCGPEASFGVWTELDLTQSGVALPPGAITADAAGFATALQAQIARRGAVELLADQETEPALLKSVADGLLASLNGRGRIELQSFYAPAPQRAAAVALIASDRSAASFRMGAGGSVVLQLEHHDGELPDLATVLPAPMQSAPALPMIRPGQPASLAGLGQPDIIGNTHYFRHEIAFALPPDWLLLANQKARLQLHYGAAPDLPQGAILLVRVNGETVRLLPLDRDGGRILPPLPVDFAANLLHPGRNSLAFEMMVPGAPPDESCPSRSTDMLVVTSDSNLTVPPSPPMALPGMGDMLASLSPQALRAGADSDDLRRLALRIASGLEPPAAPSGDVALKVARISDLQNLPLEGTGITRRMLRELLFHSLASKGEDAPQPAQPASPRFRLSDEAATAAPEPGRLPERVENLLSDEGWLGTTASRVSQSAFIGSGEDLAGWMGRRSGVALLWRPQPGELWLIMGSQADADQVSDALRRLIASGQATGEAALLDAGGEWDIWAPIRPPVMLGLPRAGELRAVLGNYASWSPLVFTLALLGLALLSALPALIYIRTSRGRKESR